MFAVYRAGQGIDVTQRQTRTLTFRMHPQLMTRQLGQELYPPAEALNQLVANSLDAGASHVTIEVHFNDLDAPDQVTISDDGCGITPAELDGAYAEVGLHRGRPAPPREVIGTKGIGRFAIYSLAAESHWTTVADVDGARVLQAWTLHGRALTVNVDEGASPDIATGTRIVFIPRDSAAVIRLFSGLRGLKRSLFNAFASYLLRYRGEVQILVNDDVVDPDNYVEGTAEEDILETDAVPAAKLLHLLLGQQVEQAYPCMLQFATHGATIKSQPIEGELVAGRKYLGLVDSPYLSELTNTAKSDLASMDTRFVALEAEASQRARRYIADIRGEQAKTFIEEARERPYYPYRNPSNNPVEEYSRNLYDNVLVALEQGFGISTLNTRLQRLVFLLAQQLLQSDDLASILTSVLDLKGEHVTKLAELLKTTSLTSIISVAELIVGRFQFLDELLQLVYGPSADRVRERKELHHILERHTWLFGEQYNLMSSDAAIKSLLPTISAAIGQSTDTEVEDRIEVDEALRDVPDLYLLASKWHEGPQYHQHLIVELKRPSVRIRGKHIEQLKRYASQIVPSPIFSQADGRQRFTFIVISSEVSNSVKMTEYQEANSPGLIRRPAGLGHPTELWALQWSDIVDQRRAELAFLREHVQLYADPAALDYLRRTVGEFLPAATSLEPATAEAAT